MSSLGKTTDTQAGRQGGHPGGSVLDRSCDTLNPAYFYVRHVLNAHDIPNDTPYDTGDDTGYDATQHACTAQKT